MERILPILQSLFRDLRSRTRDLPPDAGLPLTYDVNPEAGE